MTVDPKHHKHFVARRGDVLRKIGDEFGGVVVSFPRAGVTSDRVNLKGARNCVDAAKARILDIVQDLEEQVTIDCEIPQQYHRYPLSHVLAMQYKQCRFFSSTKTLIVSQLIKHMAHIFPVERLMCSVGFSKKNIILGSNFADPDP